MCVELSRFRRMTIFITHDNNEIFFISSDSTISIDNLLISFGKFFRSYFKSSKNIM